MKILKVRKLKGLNTYKYTNKLKETKFVDVGIFYIIVTRYMIVTIFSFKVKYF